MAQGELLAEQNFQPLAQSLRNFGRDHIEVGRVDVVTRGEQIGDHRQQAVGIVMVQSETDIAWIAKKATHLSGRMTVIELERTAGFYPADRTHAALPHRECVAIIQGHSVAADAIVAFSFPKFGVGPSFLSPTLVELIPVGFAIAAIACPLSLSIFRVLCESLSVPSGDLIPVGFAVAAIVWPPSFFSVFRVFCNSRSASNGAAGNHRCLPPPVPSVKIVARTAAPPPAPPCRAAPLLGGTATGAGPARAPISLRGFPGQGPGRSSE